MFIGVAAARHQGADRSNVGSCPAGVEVDQNLVSAPFVVFLQYSGPMTWVWTWLLLGRPGFLTRLDVSAWCWIRGQRSESNSYQSLIIEGSLHFLSYLVSNTFIICFHHDARLRNLFVIGHMTQAGNTPAFENTRRQI